MTLSERGRPGSIEVRQALWLDGILTSIEMTKISYRRLQSTLVGPQSVDRAAVASLDAWALVDTLNRLRVLITRLPGLRSKSPGAQVIVRALKPVEDLRNAVQHMDGEIGPLSATNLPLWGAIAWVQRGPDDDVLRSRTLLAGFWMDPMTAVRMNVPAIHPAGEKIESPVGPIKLTAAGRTVSLSDLVAASVSFGDRLTARDSSPSSRCRRAQSITAWCSTSGPRESDRCTHVDRVAIFSEPARDALTGSRQTRGGTSARGTGRHNVFPAGHAKQAAGEPGRQLSRRAKADA